MTETWINYSTEESKYGGQIIFFKSAEQIRGYPRMLKTVVTDADGRTVKVIYKTYIPEMRNYQTIPCMDRSEKKWSRNTPEEMQKQAETLLAALEKKMTQNTPDDLQEIVVNLLVDLEYKADCSAWECSECPFNLKETEEDPRYGKHNCGWLLLKSATSKILRK